MYSTTRVSKRQRLGPGGGADFDYRYHGQDVSAKLRYVVLVDKGVHLEIDTVVMFVPVVFDSYAIE